MATGPGFPGAQNAYIPNWEDSGRMTVGFSRDPKSFAYNRYISYSNTPHNVFYYLKWNNQAQARVINVNRYLWAYGHNRPVPGDPEAFRYIQCRTTRRDYAYGHDLDTISQANNVNLMQVDRRGRAQLAATSRASRIITALTTTANWSMATDGDLTVNHSGTATALGGGKFDVGTSLLPYLQKGINNAMSIATVDTNGFILSQPGKWMLIMNPDDARLIASSAEMHDYMKNSPYSYPEITGTLHDNSRYGLPPLLYGVEPVIDGTVAVTSEAGAATLTRGYLWPSGTMALVYRPDQLDGVYGEKPFSTFTVFYRAADEGGRSIDATGIDLVVSEFTDARNRMWEGHITEETTEIVTCPASGYLITSATAAF